MDTVMMKCVDEEMPLEMRWREGRWVQALQGRSKSVTVTEVATRIVDCLLALGGVKISNTKLRRRIFNIDDHSLIRTMKSTANVPGCIIIRQHKTAWAFGMTI